jgi:hypothetical protein
MGYPVDKGTVYRCEVCMVPGIPGERCQYKPCASNVAPVTLAESNEIAERLGMEYLGYGQWLIPDWVSFFGRIKELEAQAR